MIGGNAQNITLARFAQRGFYFSRAVHAVRRNKREGTFAAIARAIILRAICGFVANLTSPGTWPPSCVGIVRPCLRTDKVPGR